MDYISLLSSASQFIIIFVIFIGFAIWMHFSDKNKQKLINELISGDKILINQIGIIGTIEDIYNDYFVVKISDNIRINILKRNVSKYMEK